MTKREFIFKFRRGLGSAIVEIINEPDKNRYRNIVLKMCHKDLAFDYQSEGTKGHYLYDAICAMEAKDEFEDDLIAKFKMGNYWRASRQLMDILYFYVLDGSMKSQEAMQNRYRSLKELLLQRSSDGKWNIDFMEFEWLAIRLMELLKWSAFTQTIRDLIAISASQDHDSMMDYAWFLACGVNQFGEKRISGYLDRISSHSDEARAFAASAQEDLKLRMVKSDSEFMEIGSLESYITRADDLKNADCGTGKMRASAQTYAKTAAPEELQTLASMISNEHDPSRKANLLVVFAFTEYPGDPYPLMDAIRNGEERLFNAAVSALKRIRSERVHDFAGSLLSTERAETGYELLTNLWRKTDEDAIRTHLARKPKITHDIQLSLMMIYSHHRSNTCGDILETIYEKGECSYCRYEIVKALARNKVAKDSLFFECRYDSYVDTRRWAEKRLMKHPHRAVEANGLLTPPD